MQGEICKNCRWFDDDGMPAGVGMCRRYPPALIVTPSPQGPQEVCKFPMTGIAHWCGEYKTKIILMQ